jgi:hypothetical protein
MYLPMRAMGFAVLILSGCGAGPTVIPKNIDAKDNAAVFEDGTRVELFALEKDTSDGSNVRWTPGGVLVPESQRSEVGVDPSGRLVRLLFHVKNRPPDASVFCYVPDGARLGLNHQEQLDLGWRFGGWPGATDYDHVAMVSVNPANASRFLFGIASGPYHSLGRFPNKFRGDELQDGQAVIRGDGWKTIARVPPRNLPSTKTLRAGLETLATDGTYHTDYNLHAYDITGKEIANGPGGDASIFVYDLPRIDHFEMQAREIPFAMFSGIHYDPVDSQPG